MTRDRLPPPEKYSLFPMQYSENSCEIRVEDEFLVVEDVWHDQRHGRVVVTKSATALIPLLR